MEQHVHFRGGFGEGEKAGAESRFDIVAKVRFAELVHTRSQVDHGHAFGDVEPFDLVEHKAVGGVDGVGAIDAPGGDDANGRLTVFHRANLHRGGLRAEHRLAVAQIAACLGGCDVKIIERITGRVAGGDIEVDEVMLLIFDLRPVDHLEAHSPEDVAQFVDRLRENVGVTDPGRLAGERDVFDRG